MPTETFFNLPDEKRERFLTVAIDEFADNDYRNASISRICREVGIAKGSFYQYFADKKALFMYLIDLTIEEKRALLGQIEIPEGLDMFGRLRWLFEMQMQFDFAHPRLTEVGYRALYGDLPFRDDLLETLRAQATLSYRQMVLDGVADGSVNPDVDVDTAVFMIVSVFNELGNYLQKRLGISAETMVTRQLTAVEWAEAGKLFDELTRLLQSGLGNHSPT